MGNKMDENPGFPGEIDKIVAECEALETTIMMTCRVNNIGMPICLMVFEKMFAYFLFRAEGKTTQMEEDTGRKTTTEERMAMFAVHVKEWIDKWEEANRVHEAGTDHRTPEETGMCCMARHARAVPPWTCDCDCHKRPQVDINDFDFGEIDPKKVN